MSQNPIEPIPIFTTDIIMKGSSVASDRVLLKHTLIRAHNFLKLIMFSQLQSNNVQKHPNQAKCHIEQQKYLSACTTQLLASMTIQITSMHGRKLNHVADSNWASDKYSLSTISPHLHILFSMVNMTPIRFPPRIILHKSSSIFWMFHISSIPAYLF